MKHDPDKLLAALQDGTIDAESFEALSRWVQASPDHALRFAEWSLLEQHTREIISAQRSAGEHPPSRAPSDGDPSDSAVLEAVIEEALSNRRKAEAAERAGRLLAAQQDAEADARASAQPDDADTPGPIIVVIPKGLAYAAVVLLTCGVLGAIYLATAGGDTPQTPALTEQTPPAAHGSPDPTNPDSADAPAHLTPPIQAPAIQASVTDQRGVGWAAGSATPDASGVLQPGRYDLATGFLRVSFGEGVDTILHAPTRFAIGPQARFALERGKAWAHVTEAGVGFTVHTPTGRFVDLGTAFGVEVDEAGRSALHVAEGKVQANLLDIHEDQPPVLVTQGLAVQTSVDGRALSGVPVVPELFANDWAQTQTPIDLRELDNVRYLYSPPPSLKPGAIEHDDELVVVLERAGVLLDQPVMAEVFGPGRYDTWPATPRALSPGKRVDSYLVHYDRVGRPATELEGVGGVIRFDRPILAVITHYRSLDATDATLGAPGTDYGPLADARGLEQVSRDRRYQDELLITRDRKTLVVKMETSYGVDQVRVLVESE